MTLLSMNGPLTRAEALARWERDEDFLCVGAYGLYLVSRTQLLKGHQHEIVLSDRERFTVIS